jgi:nuclear transport factor 2 (NTF2) superfamily protein
VLTDQAQSLAYTADSRWRNRSEFVTGREHIISFLRRKWDIA